MTRADLNRLGLMLSEPEREQMGLMARQLRMMAVDHRQDAEDTDWLLGELADELDTVAMPIVIA